YEKATIGIAPEISADVTAETLGENFAFDERLLDNIFQELQPAPATEPAPPRVDDPLALARDYVSKGLMDVAAAEAVRAVQRRAGGCRRRPHRPEASANARARPRRSPQAPGRRRPQGRRQGRRPRGLPRRPRARPGLRAGVGRPRPPARGARGVAGGAGGVRAGARGAAHPQRREPRPGGSVAALGAGAAGDPAARRDAGAGSLWPAGPPRFGPR